MASSSSSSRWFSSLSLQAVAIASAIALTALIISFSTQRFLSDSAAPFDPRDAIPKLPRDVPWPQYVGSATSNGVAAEWKAPCFEKNTAWFELYNKSGSEFGGGTLHIKVDKADTLVCFDTYFFVTSRRMKGDYYFLAKEHAFVFEKWEEQAEYEFVKSNGVSIFLVPSSFLDTISALREVIEGKQIVKSKG